MMVLVVQRRHEYVEQQLPSIPVIGSILDSFDRIDRSTSRLGKLTCVDPGQNSPT